MKVELSDVRLKREGDRITAVIRTDRGTCRRLASEWGAELKASFLSDGEDIVFCGRRRHSGLWEAAWGVTELIYFRLVEAGVPPQEAEGVLPDSVMAEAKLTLDPDGWKRFCEANFGHLTALSSNKLKELCSEDDAERSA